jgi:hypothetical protein
VLTKSLLVTMRAGFSLSGKRLFSLNVDDRRVVGIGLGPAA